MAAPLRLLLRRAGPLALLLVLLQYCPLAVDSMEDGLARKPPRGFRTWNCFVRKTHLCLSCLLTGSNDRWRRRWLATVLLPAVPHRDCAAWWLGLTACWPLLAAVCCLLPAEDTNQLLCLTTHSFIISPIAIESTILGRR